MSEESFRYTSAPERRSRLLQFIADEGYCTITDLSAAFGVSEMTIRRDVLKLSEQGKVRAFRGGVGTVGGREVLGSDYRFRDVSMAAQKHAIASAAERLIQRDAVIAIDAGTTTNQLAVAIPGGQGIKVVTHSFPVIASLVGNPGVEVISLGGTLHPESLSFDGPSTLAAISNLQVQTFFLAASGVTDRGAFCGNDFDAITKRAIIDVSERVVLLADSSKFEAPSMHMKICGWDPIDQLITDSGITEEQRRMLEDHGVEVTVVDAELGSPADEVRAASL
jgi:DeoR family transcriptional regulator, aga operon transcriptional repressor